VTQEDARRRARSRKASPTKAAPQAGGRQAPISIRTDYYEPPRIAAHPVAQFSPVKEFFWWLLCHLAWAWQQLEYWLASRRKGAPVCIVEGVVDCVRVDNAAFDAYEEMGLSVAAHARHTHDYLDDDRKETYFRVTPVVLTLDDGRVIHFCEYQITDRPVPSNAPYFAGLKGIRVRAAGWWDGDAFSAWGLRLQGQRAQRTVYATRQPRNLPEPLETLLSRRTHGFSELMNSLGVLSGIAAMTMVFLILSAKLDLAGAGFVMAWMTAIFLSIPVLVLLGYALVRAMTGPLRPIPEMMAAGEFGNRHLRLRTYDFGRCERDVVHALDSHR